MSAVARAVRVEDFIGPPRRERTRTIADAPWKRVLVDVVEMMGGRKSWEDAKARHLVALYAKLHHDVYGVEAAELTPAVRFFASGLAARLVKNEFNGDMVAMAAFMRWAWQREKWRESKRQGGGGFRLGYRLQFSLTLVTDYRAERHRTLHKSAAGG